MHDTAQELRETVERYLKRTGTSPTRLGREALKRPGFVRAFLNGSSPRLDTADSLLVHMGLEPIGPRFRCEVETYLQITGANRSAPGEQALNDTAFVGRLFDGLLTTVWKRAYSLIFAREAQCSADGWAPRPSGR